jgi:enamine deaminase RidA (YjgF/YER057c/UK114 family)
MTIQRYDAGARMSQAVVYGGVAYLSGQVAAPGESVSRQTEAVLKQITQLLERVGSNKSRLLTAVIWLADMADFAEMNSVWDAWIDGQDPPTRATGEARLATADYKVEIIISAAMQ